MTSREKAYFMLNEIMALQNYTAGFTAEDYTKQEHAQYIQQESQKLMVFMFKEKYGNNDDAASNALQLILIKQVSELNMPPEKLMEFVNVLLPKTRATIEATIAEMIRCGDEEVDESLLPKKPINPLAN